MNTFDKTKEYKKNIKDKVEEIIKLCNQNNIPCFLSFGVKLDEDGEFIFNGKSLLPEALGIENNSRMFSDLVNVTNGFIATPPKKTDEIDFSDFSLPTMED